MNWKSSSIFFVCGFLFLLSPGLTHAAVTPDDPGNFITTWNTENPGTSNNDQITIPHANGSTYNYEIYWENTASSTQTGTTTVSGSDAASSPTLTFPEPGIYEVQASGTFPRIYFNNGGDKDKILTVEQWGNIAWTSMNSAFHGASNLRVPATDAPDLSGVTIMADMFTEAISFNDPINHWDVSSVERFDAVFREASSFNQPLDDWDVSSVTNLYATFEGAVSFNQPLNSWDVSNVTLMTKTFKSAESFNQPLNQWDTSNVTAMEQMFAGCCGYGAPPFDQDISTWNFESIANSGRWPQRGLRTFLRGVRLSQENLDALLVSMANQNLNNNVPFHLGLKTYSSTGAQALQTLRDTYNWTITEQYQAEYRPSSDATLYGTSVQAPLNSGATTTAVEIDPDRNCTFQEWSDGNTDNPRQDVLTDNLSVTAELSCRTYGTSARTQREKQAEFNTLDDSDSDTTANSWDDTLSDVKDLTENPLPPLDPVRDRETITELIKVLLELVEALTQLLLMREEGA